MRCRNSTVENIKVMKVQAWPNGQPPKRDQEIKSDPKIVSKMIQDMNIIVKSAIYTKLVTRDYKK